MHTTTLRRARLALAASVLALPLLVAPLAAQTRLLETKNSVGDSVMFLSGDGGFALLGPSTGGGSIPIQGLGTRLMWYPAKSAFRAGTVWTLDSRTGTEWDDANIGTGSVAMGDGTMASGQESFAMGRSSSATGNYAVAFGDLSTASGFASVAAGASDQATGNYAVALGQSNTANSDFSMALGAYAVTNGFEGAVVISDASTETSGVGAMTATAVNQFSVRAAGGVRLRTSSDTLSGCDIDSSGNMTCTGTVSGTSDVNRKKDFTSVNADQVLSKLADLPIDAWSYKRDPAGVRHVGPMAQAFHAAFGLGANDVTIATVDADGVNMLAIQALKRRTDALRKQVKAAQTENAELRQRLQRLEAVVQQLAAKDGTGGGPTPK